MPPKGIYMKDFKIKLVLTAKLIIAGFEERDLPAHRASLNGIATRILMGKVADNLRFMII